MNLNDRNNNYDFSLADDTENGYYFILKDTPHHCTYDVVLVKDTGDITVNGSYINDIPRDLAGIISNRVDYFVTKKNLANKVHHKKEAKKSEKKETSNKEKKKAKKSEKKEAPKKEKKESKKEKK